MCVVSVRAEVGPVGRGTEGPACRERTVKTEVVLGFELLAERGLGVRGGWRAKKATKG
jgi:hypothetical protein